MKPEFWLTVRGVQEYDGIDPDTIELSTEASLTSEDGVLFLSYPESALTGLAGTVTTFEIRPDRVVLRRRGTVNNEMEFVPGEVRHSLYDFGHGALLVTVRTTRIDDNMTVDGGTLTVSYRLCLENLGSGKIEYRLSVRRLDPDAPAPNGPGSPDRGSED